jgi:two-component system, OmpR family, sensor histidine kinase KdpD
LAAGERRRPDPDELLARVREAEQKRRRGRLKIFFGAAPGVGKTYAMLEAARDQAREGRDVAVGVVETHGRSETAALLEGLEILPLRELSYRGTHLTEFDLDAALERHPALLIVDELAHSNAPGTRHAKRFRDVEEILAAGIDVYTTLNVQHLESLNDVVAQITAVTVRERVPDAIFDNADDIEMVDLPVDELRKRLAEGRVYVPVEAERAAESFFRPGNLIALRELALRRAAERVDAQMQLYRAEHAVGGTWPTAERLLVCVAPSPYASRLVRTTRRIAANLKASWVAVHVETPEMARLAAADRAQLQRTLQLAEQLGAEVVTLSGADVAEEVVAYAQRRNVSRIVVGKPSRRRWRERIAGSFVDRVIRASGAIDVLVVSGVGDEPAPVTLVAGSRSSPLRGYAIALAVTALASAVAATMFPLFALANLVMVYLLAVLIVALREGRGPAVAASILSVAAFDFLFVPPRFTFAVADTQYLFTFGVMLAVALVISGLTARLRDQAFAARARERRTAALFAVSRASAGAAQSYEIVRTATREVAGVLDAGVVAFLPHQDGRLAVVGEPRVAYPTDRHELAVAQWVFEHGERAGLGTETLPGAAAFYVPLLTSGGVKGVLGVRPGPDTRPFGPDEVQLITAFADQIALAVERTNLAAQAQAAALAAETERARSVILSSISHDLRTPLATIAGAAETLSLHGETLPEAERRGLADSIHESATRLAGFVGNLLEMARLATGSVKANRELQPLDEVIGAALNETEDRLQGRPVAVEVAPDLPMVALDAVLITQVLVNLLDNAARYTPAASPLEIRAVRAGECAAVTVADRGPGVAAGEEDATLAGFRRGDSGRGGRGAGLGLAICREIVRLHGGTLTATNRPEGGRAVTFTLPLAAAAHG